MTAGLETTSGETRQAYDDRGLHPMVSVMGIEKHADYYRGYQPAERSLFPVAIVLATLVSLWLLVYLVSALGPVPAETASVKANPQPKYAVTRSIRQ